jgi:putative addiction module antidote
VFLVEILPHRFYVFAVTEMNAMNEQSKVIADSRPQPIAKVEIQQIGDATGVILPKEVMARLNLSVGDELYATITSDGGICLTPYDPKFEKAMNVARRGMKQYHNALAELAK